MHRKILIYSGLSLFAIWFGLSGLFGGDPAGQIGGLLTPSRGGLLTPERPGDFDNFVDTMTLDANLTVSSGSGTFSTTWHGNFTFADSASISGRGKFDMEATATASWSIDSSSGTQGACLKLKDADGSGFTYCRGLDGTLTCNATACE
jgi:hypothetical protein